ncbi:hypothetical protein TSOC_000379 [Tetrabaena socialis]|uniref:Uncharacterized protein n=1 Tax=Tetrabaena socialis TaxID=47790 RepID=A0A2J8AJI7_9CHLO|nr:hypothetical protein TSOC_000379 [Tetrabaena socialis]|eukprot:PNH12678.1 hypothetical protein TSOC_000379 [Tetrabaena socialis]
MQKAPSELVANCVGLLLSERRLTMDFATQPVTPASSPGARGKVLVSAGTRLPQDAELVAGPSRLRAGPLLAVAKLDEPPRFAGDQARQTATASPASGTAAGQGLGGRRNDRGSGAVLAAAGDSHPPWESLNEASDWEYARGSTASGRPSATTAQAPPDADWPPRSREQQHDPPSPPSTSAAYTSDTPGAARRSYSNRSQATASAPGGHRTPPRPPPSPPPPYQQQQPQQQQPSRQEALLSQLDAARNWFEVRAVLVRTGSGVGGGGGPAASASSSCSSHTLLAVLRRLAAVTRYDMRPPEAAALGAFLGQWLAQHTGALAAMGPTELSLCLHSLAKLARALPIPPPAWTGAWLAAAQPHLSRAAFRPKDLSLSLWAVSRLRLGLPPAALQLLLAAAEPHLGRFNGQDLSLVALALSVLCGARPTPSGPDPGDPAPGATSSHDDVLPLPSASWQRRFLFRASEVLPACSSQGLANLLHGAVRAGLGPSDRLLADLCAALYDHLPYCTPQALANTLSALAAAGHVPPGEWVGRFWTASAARMAGGGGGGAGGRGEREEREAWCNADDLAHLAAAAAQLGLVPPQWWTARLYAAAEEALPSASPRQLAQLLHAAAQLHRLAAAAEASPGAGERVEAGGGREAKQQAQQQQWNGVLAGAAGADGRASGGGSSPDGGGGGLGSGNGAGGASASFASARPPRSLLSAWHAAAASCLPGFNSLDASHSLWALSALAELPPRAWLQGLLLQLSPSLASMPPAELAVLLWSLAALRFRPSWSWLTDCLEASGPALGRMGGQDFAMLTTAMVRLGCRVSKEWSGALLAALRPQLQRLSCRCLAQTAWAMYRLRIQPPPEWLGELADVLAARPRALRRRRRAATHPGSLVASLGGSLCAAAALRDAAAARLMAAALAATEPLLAAATLQDLGLLGAAMSTLAPAARLAARRRPSWVRALLAAARPRMGTLPANGLRRLLAGLRAAGAAVEPGWAADCAAAALPYLRGRAVAAAKLALLRQLCGLRLQPAGGAAAPPPRAAAAEPALEPPQQRRRAQPAHGLNRHGTARQRGAVPLSYQPGAVAASGPALAAAVASMRAASGSADALLRLHVELLKARVRLRKLSAVMAAAGSSGGGGGAGSAGACLAAATRRITTLAAAAAEGGGRAGSGGGNGNGAGAGPGAYDAASLAAATATARGAVADAAAAVAAAAGPRGRQVLHLGELQRAWIWTRARRTVAGHLAESSPVLIVLLVELVAQQLPPPLPPSSYGTRVGGPAAAAGRSVRGAAHPAARSPGPVALTPAPPLLPLCLESMLWLAGATGSCWRWMRPPHRARVRLAWRRLLRSLSDREGAEAAMRVAAQLPVEIAATGGAWGAGRLGPVGEPPARNKTRAAGTVLEPRRRC